MRHAGTVLTDTNALSPSWPDLTRPSTTSDEVLVQIAPVRIFSDDKSELPGTRPMLDVFFSLERDADIVVPLDIDQPLQSIALRKALGHAFPVFPNAPREITRDTNVESTARSVRQDVEPSALHQISISRTGSCGNVRLDGRVKPGHDVTTSTCPDAAERD